MADESGSEERFYGKLREVVKAIRTVASETGPKPEVYTTEMAFDSFGRMRRLVYPDGDVPTYTYDRGGQLATTISQKRGNTYRYVTHLGYDEFAQRVRLVYGNRVETRYAYDPLRRFLVRLTTTTASGTALQALTYRYDPVGNMLATTNATPVQRFGSVTLGPVEQTYRYDDLDHLVEAAGRFEFAPRKVNRYSSIFTYDPIHNLTAKVQTHTIDQPSGAAVEQEATTYGPVHHPQHLRGRVPRRPRGGYDAASGPHRTRARCAHPAPEGLLHHRAARVRSGDQGDPRAARFGRDG